MHRIFNELNKNRNTLIHKIETLVGREKTNTAIQRIFAKTYKTGILTRIRTDNVAMSLTCDETLHSESKLVLFEHIFRKRDWRQNI